MICAWFSRKRKDWHNWCCDISVYDKDKQISTDMLMSGIVTSYENGKYSIDFDEFVFGNIPLCIGEIEAKYSNAVMNNMIADCDSLDESSVSSELKDLYKLIYTLKSFFSYESSRDIFTDNIDKISLKVKENSLLDCLLLKIGFSDCGENMDGLHCWQTNW